MPLYGTSLKSSAPTILSEVSGISPCRVVDRWPPPNRAARIRLFPAWRSHCETDNLPMSDRSLPSMRL